jgi:4-amino-4-deoxy-L-arabinose transferase-like glycosyltransferase
MQPKNLFILIAIGALLFIPFLGHVHLFDWDEINFAESAREMLVTHKFSQVQINFEPFYEKPPFFMWMQAISMSVFGANEFAARLPNAVIGIITLIVIFNIGTKLVDDRFGWLWVFCYIGSFLPHFYFKTGLIDPLFNLFIFYGIYQFVRLTNMENFKPSKATRTAVLAGVFIGLGILTKGPVALLITMFCLFMYWVSFRFRPVIPFQYLLIFLISAFVVSCAWFGIDTFRNGPKFIFAFIERQVALFRNPDAGHDGPFYYHFIVLLFGCFPASLFMFSALKHDVSETYKTRNMKNWMVILLIAVLFIFSIVRTKIIHYSSLAYFPITFLAAYGLFRMIYLSRNRINPLLTLGLSLVSALVGTILFLIPWLGRHPEKLVSYITDDFGKAAIRAQVHWTGWESAIGILYFIIFMIGAFLFTRKEVRIFGAIGIFVAGALCVQLSLLFLAPKIEAYSQKAAIDFFAEKQNEDCYMDVWGYHSYAQYFYGKRKPGSNMSKPYDANIFYSAKIDKPAYIVLKINDGAADDFIRNHNFKIIDQKNGFVFLKREKDN